MDSRHPHQQQQQKQPQQQQPQQQQPQQQQPQQQQPQHQTQQQQQQHHYPTNASPPLQGRPPHHQAHSRAQSTSSLQTMPPPTSTSPPNGGHPGQHYGPPPSLPPPRAPTAFSARELPSLSSLSRNATPAGSSMSISSMLGGPPSVHRDAHGYPHPPPQQQQQQQQQQQRAPSGAPPNYAPSPRIHSAANEYPPFRRPHTPDHQRPYEPRYSPGQAQQQQQQQQQPQSQQPKPPSHQPTYGTPDQRYQTPHYHSRNPSASTEPSRDRVSSGPPPPPARPSSQPKAYMPRPEDAYPRPPEYPDRRPPYPYDERYREREREREMEEQQAREGRGRAYSGGEGSRQSAHPPPYGHEPDPRDAQWGRPGSDPNYCGPMSAQPPRPHEYPPQNGPPGYPPQPPYHHQQQGPRPPYKSPDRSRAPLPQHPHQLSQQQHPGPPPPSGPGQQMQPHPDAQRQPLPARRDEPPTGPYSQSAQAAQHYDRQRMEDPMAHQRNLLAVHDINRNKGRVSPLPQAVQGAQPQQHGPGGEPGIKNEFGRIFPGIGNGVSGLGMSSPTAASAQFATSSLGRREDEAESGADATGKGKGRRRKLKEEADEDGRSTPSKVKRTKQPLPSEPTIPRSKPESPPAQTQAPPPKPKPVPLPPKPKTIVRNAAVLDAASKYPRHHLGDFIYEPGLKASRLLPNVPTHRGFSSNPTPLPMEKIKGQINCTLTVKISHVHLAPPSREEITARQYLWGTDIYTDDSDVVAACIHAGWIKGEWMEDVDSDMLDIEVDGKRRKKLQPVNASASEGLIMSTPAPMIVPEGRDLHVNVLILPRLMRYGSVTRHGMTSREFGGTVGHRHLEHDGLSFMIQSLRWVENGAQPQARLRGKARRDRMRKAMQERRCAVNTTPPNGSSGEAGEKKTLGQGEISGVWRSEGKAGVGGADGDKENTAESATGPVPQATEGPATADVDMADEKGVASGAKTE